MRWALLLVLMLMATGFAADDLPLLEAPSSPQSALEAEAPTEAAMPAPEDDFPLFLAALAMISSIGALVLIGIGMVVAAIAVVGIAILVALGILSSSVLVGLLNRRVIAGLRALHYQVLGALGAVGSMGVIALWTHLFAPSWTTRDVILVGSLSGAVAGVVLAWVLDRLVSFLHRRFSASLAVR